MQKAAFCGALVRPAVTLRLRCRSHPSRSHRAPPTLRRVRAQQDDQGEPASPPPTDPADPSVSSESPGGAPLPAADNQEPSQAADLQLPPEVVARLRDSVFSLDTLFVRSVENYGQNGVLFKGNLRGDPSAAHAKMAARLQREVGDAYRLFLLEDQEENPVAVVLPVASVQPVTSPGVEAGLAVTLAGATFATTLNTFGAELFNAALLEAKFDPALVAAALPGSFATLAILAAHEAGHLVAAKRVGMELAPPVLVPAGLGLLGSFGGITRIRSSVPNRKTLAAVTVAGPLAGSAVALAILLLGLTLTASGSGGIEVDTASFKESILIGGLARAALGEAVFTSDAVNCHPALVAGWAGLIINAINSLPMGELDGGRLVLALFGRRAASRLGAVTFFIIGVWGFTNGLFLFWLLFTLSVQRGPIIPCEEELTPLPQGGALKVACLAALLLPLLMLLPFPSFNFDVGEAMMASF